jgi:hypothetical protein
MTRMRTLLSKTTLIPVLGALVALTAQAGRKPASATPLKPYEGSEVVLDTLAAFEEVCLDEKGRIFQGAVTNAELLADPNGGAINCPLAAEMIGEQLDRLDRDLARDEAAEKVAQGGSQ